MVTFPKFVLQFLLLLKQNVFFVLWLGPLCLHFWININISFTFLSLSRYFLFIPDPVPFPFHCVENWMCDFSFSSHRYLLQPEILRHRRFFFRGIFFKRSSVIIIFHTSLLNTKITIKMLFFLSWLKKRKLGTNQNKKLLSFSHVSNF